MSDIKFSGNCHTHSCVSEQVIRTDDGAVRIEQLLASIERTNVETLEAVKAFTDVVLALTPALDRSLALLREAMRPTLDELRAWRLREDLDRTRKAFSHTGVGPRP